MSNYPRSHDISTPRVFAPHRPLLRLFDGSHTSSSSPDLDMSDQDEDHPEPFVLSGANTPVREDRPRHASSPYGSFTATSGRSQPPKSDDAGQVSFGLPILPTKECRTVAATPPAPLSARGDVPGGYFPFHEDPASRLHRPHPFYLHKSQPRSPSPEDQGQGTQGSGNPTFVLTGDDPKHVTAPPTNSLVTSYVPSGIHGSSLPMGKYYPSNYENRMRHHHGLAVPITSGIATKSVTQTPTFSSAGESPRVRDEGEAKRKLQQYQRDMIAQATLAARKVLGSDENSTLTLPGFPVPGLPAGAAPATNPISPRLRPLGSPGPVTPMELEATDGSYLDKGRDSHAVGNTSRDADCSRAMTSEERMQSAPGSYMASPAY